MGFYSSVELTFSWRGRSFLVGKILINTRILRDPSLWGPSWLGLIVGCKIFFCIDICGGQGRSCWTRHAFYSHWPPLIPVGLLSSHHPVSLIQVHEVYTHPSFPVGFFNYHYIGHLVRVVHLSDEFCILQFADFFRYSSISLWGKYSLLLTDMGKIGWYIQPVHHDWKVDPRHISMTPSEDVLVFF